MPRLIVQPGSPDAREINLKSGTNSLGRGPANDFTLDDPSVSGTHCQIVVEGGKAVIRDLGSTNGTYVNRAPVKEAALQAGQTLHLGSLEILFYADAPAGAGVASPPLPPPRAVASAGAIRVARPGTVARIPTPPPPLAVPPQAAPPPIATPSGPCKLHPKVPGRHFCTHCQLLFCEACVTTRAHKKHCRQCGAECVPARVTLQRAAASRGFFARLPGAFAYPFLGSGVLMLIVSAVVISIAEGFTGFWMSIPLMIAAYGYIFSFLQNIIHATANEEEEMPDLPGLDDVFGGALRLGMTVLICFGLPLALFVLRLFEWYDAPATLQIAAMLLGCLYFPMAFLAVAMKDTALAANPLVVIPAILKVPLGYLVTCTVVVGVYLLRLLGDALAGGAESIGYQTRDMQVMFLTFGLRAVWGLIRVYLLAVSMRILGLLYVANKQKFGWFDR
ncbi:MAG TPA: FHA domain-containing protein [Candidatus Paceibacterota bacterium]|nr:FHA domain-containing protein [Verrucomicrobiota bacterium]HSA09023.1 FHA domain-containing protein [Candidatus Paceibacterota bacterium]